MSIRIENIQNCKVAYLRQVGPYDPNNIKLIEKIKNGLNLKIYLMKMQ